jgi:3',5'-nucleoside bisphosphate phosphatase
MPNTTCDLHLHTYYSDGRASPAEVLRHAASIGLKTVAITDHNSLKAMREATHMAAELGLELIPAIELATRWAPCSAKKHNDDQPQEVDLLGYDIDPDDQEFMSFIQASFEDMRQRVVDCCDLLTRAGYPISIHDVEDENPRYPGSMKIISALHQKGYASSWNDALPLFTVQWSHVRRPRLAIEKAIDAIHAAGGIAVLAHPIAVRCDGGWLQAEQLDPLVEAGLDGLEVLHPSLDMGARHHFRELAKQFGLLVTGGSDEHGWPGGFSRMGSEMITYDMVKAMYARSRKRVYQRYKLDLS